MQKLKKLWLWISGGIAILFGLFVIIFKFIVPNQQRKGEFKKKNRELEKEKKDIDTKIIDVETERAKLERDIKVLETKIETEYHLLSDVDRKSAIQTLHEFKKKYENE
jgi:septal ring factor EnvC (AmiA/AmiB activator)